MNAKNTNYGLKGDGISVRYVVLRHTGVVPEHFDLMIQLPGAERLATWRILIPPETWGRQMPAAERLADHRVAYLTYEGAVSGGRGEVKRVAEGEGEYVAGVGLVHLRLRGNLECEIRVPV